MGQPTDKLCSMPTKRYENDTWNSFMTSNKDTRAKS